MKTNGHNQWFAWILIVVGLPAALPAQTPVRMPENIRQLSELSEKERQQLKQKQVRFDQLDEAAQDELRQFYQALQKDPDQERLTQVMHAYTQWLAALPSAQRRHILSLAPDQRLTEIAHAISEQKTERFKELLRTRLDLEDLKIASAWWNRWEQSQQAHIMEAIGEIEESVFENIPNRVKAIRDPEVRRRMILIASFDSIGKNRWLHWFPQWSENLTELLGDVSQSASEIYQEAQGADEQLELIMRWGYYASMADRYPALNIDDRTLELFYRDELSESDRDFVDRLPAKQYRSTLQRLYFRYKRPRNFPGLDEGNVQRPPRP